jgi:methyl-accepting chemotaxis protein
MKLFNDLRIASKLMLAFAVVLALTAALGAFSLFQLATVNRAAEEIDRNWLPSVRAVLELKAATGRHRSVVLQAIISDDAARMDQYEKRIADFAGEFEQHQRRYEALIASSAERQAYLQLTGLWAQYVAESKKLTGLAREQRGAEAIAASRGESSRLATALHTQIGKLVELNAQGSANASEAAKATYDAARTLVIGGLVLAIVLGLALARALARIVARPLEQAVAIAEAVAAGNLAAEARASAQDETGKLLAALQRMSASLRHMVAEVRSGAHAIATASSQIAAGNADLSARTEEQASSLEETAASMEELTGTVKHNADNSRQAARLAGTAADVAVRGGAVVAEVVETMATIEAAARKIANITGVVDSIAFQTNILALNAAVEAARAGEQGRGFAVVAAEVRNLAQRSAAAAREIKTLIDDSVEKVGLGTRLAGQAGVTMDEVVASVRRVSDIVGEIGAASREQAEGIEQVNHAVVQMDQMTQQNATLVEEAAAASEAMQEQAQALTLAVSAFVLDASGQAAPALRSAAPQLALR